MTPSPLVSPTLPGRYGLEEGPRLSKDTKLQTWGEDPIRNCVLVIVRDQAGNGLEARCLQLVLLLGICVYGGKWVCGEVGL